MGETIFHDIYSLARHISQYLPLGEGLALDMEVSSVATMPGRNVREGRHWAIFAKTGDGKTVFDKALIRAYVSKEPWLNVYILDSKKLGDFTERDGKIWNTYDPPPPLKGIGMKQVWQPVEDDIEAYDQYFRAILAEGKPAIVLVDESKNLKFGGRTPKGYELILSQGRKPGISVITNYQEIAEALRQGISQATHVVGFSMWNAYDERQMKAYLKLPTDKPIPRKGKHSFLYLHRDNMGSPMLFSGYQDFIKTFQWW